MKKAILTVGISASGKSTFAKEWLARTVNGVEINRDNIRKMLAESNGGKFSWEKWNWKREGEVTRIQEDAIKTFAAMGHPMILSDTNLNPKTRKALTVKLKSLGYEVEIIEFPVTLEEAWKRDAARENGVGHSVIAKQYQDWLAYKGKPHVYVCPDDRFTKCVLVDIDGTLAHMNGKRGAFEWHNVGRDDVDEQVRFLVNAIPGDVVVIVMSGRDEVCRAETEEWLDRHDIQFDALFMRKKGDMRKDTIVKRELFDEHIRHSHNVQFVIDDRPSVCRMWRDDLGLKVFQVGDPHVEF